MSIPPAAREVFARTLITLQPYADELVLIGGWVHALYLAESNDAALPIHTTDIDLTIPHALVAGTRPALLDLVKGAGFETGSLDSVSGVIELWQKARDGVIIDLDLLTDAPDPKVPVTITGQPGLTVHGYPDQHVLLENSRWIQVGPDIHELLNPPVQIRVPTLAAYVLVKALSSVRRLGIRKRAKDLVYLLVIVRDRQMRREVIAGLGDLAVSVPDEYIAWRAVLASSANDLALMEAVADQLEEMQRVPRASRAFPSTFHLT